MATIFPPEALGERFFRRILLPGDHLLYSGTGFWSKLIKIKTWSDITHIEVYLGEGRSFASRDGIGVGTYPLRTKDLAYVLRPIEEWDARAALRWIKTVDGQKYDWWGLLRFFTIGKGKPDRMFCSEAVLRLDRAIGFHPCHVSTDADLVSPGEFLKMNPFDHWWKRRRG